MKIDQEKIDRINNSVKRVFDVIIVVSMVIGLSMLIKPLLMKLGVDLTDYVLYPLICHIYKIIGVLLGIGFILSLILLLMLSLWATDEDEQDKKRLIKEVLNEGLRQPKEQEPEPTEDGCPLTNLTAEQKRKVEQFLRDLPPHKERMDEINMKEVARFLTALVEMGYISYGKSADKIGLRQWVEKVTGKRTPEQFHFNDAYPSKNKNGVKEYERIIKKTLKI